MKTAQLPLIEELSLAHIKDSTPSSPVRKFTAPPELPHAFVLLALLLSPQPLHQLQKIAGANDGPGLIAELRELGLQLHCHEVPEPDVHGSKGRYTVYELSTADARHVKRWLKREGAKHG